MPTSILATKLFIPPPRPKSVLRPRLSARLDAGLCQGQGFGRKLTLISAPAGFGKTTVVSEWLTERQRDEGGKMKDEANLHPSKVAWLSLDEGDNDPARFLTYLIAALQTVYAGIGAGVAAALQSPQPPPAEAVLTALLNEIVSLPDACIVVLDDYHVIGARSADSGSAAAVDDALAFLLEHLPPTLHLVIATREDPRLPLARLRGRGQLVELRAADLRFTLEEAAGFLNQVMGLDLSADEITALETRTEGWIAGLQLAALSMQGAEDVAGFIQSFTGSHRFVLDYLVEEVLGRQTAGVQAFLLRTAILDRMCGPLCDAVLQGQAGQATLEYLERANLFSVPLDGERHWYRYHQLFRDLLRQRLGQSLAPDEIAGYHIRASQWHEDHGLGLEAFRYAAAANDIERAERLMESPAIPRQSREALKTVVEWLVALPKSVLDARPLLWVRSATMALMTGQTTGVEERLQAAEAVLQQAPLDAQARDLIGQIAAARATLAVTRYQPETIISQAQRALEYLPAGNPTFRFTANWALSIAYQFQGDRTAAGRAAAEALVASQASASTFSTILALTHLGRLQELENQLHQAAEAYRRVLQTAGDQLGPNTNDAWLGLARICYEWNDLQGAEHYAQRSLQQAHLFDRTLDRFILGEVFLARVKLARGDPAAATAMLAETEQTVRRENYAQRLPEVAAVQVLVMLRLGDAAAAERLAQAHTLPLSQARVRLAQGQPAAALAVLEPVREQADARNWQDEKLRVLVLQSLAYQACGDEAQAAQLLGEALALAEPGGFIRLFVDEGPPMAELLGRMKHEGGSMKEYIGNLLVAFGHQAERQPSTFNLKTLPEPLSPRELEILRLIAQGLSNREIGARLFLALDTVKGHNRRIFDKLQVQRRTEAIARARELGLL
jgi:LuxR family transcriptional regulator, maltose regulon positive regulatory protein